MSLNPKDLFPELEQIKDESLRNKSIAVVADALKLGDWTNVDDIPFTMLIPNCPANLVEHTRMVTKLAVDNAKNMQSAGVTINMDWIIAGGILHDIGKFLEYERTADGIVVCEMGKHLRHPVLGVMLCENHDMPWQIKHIIMSHSWEGDKLPRLPECEIVHRSDFIHFKVLKGIAEKK